VKLSAPVQLAKTASDTEILAAAVEMNKNFEAWIRTNPEQWLWPHRRWGKALRK
jgi:KDO2-lipid IV(A) lauroyltransferase